MQPGPGLIKSISFMRVITGGNTDAGSTANAINASLGFVHYLHAQATQQFLVKRDRAGRVTNR
jgi:hypothetical protein